MTRIEIVRATLIAACVASLSSASPAAGQRSWAVAPFLGANTSLPGDPSLAGATVSYGIGAFGLRTGFGLETWWGEGAEARTGAWAADLDVRLAPGNSSGVAPSFFAGIGLEGARDVTDDMRVAPNWSAGGGLAYAPLRWFRLESEVRYRVPFGGPASAPDPIASAGFEYRVGVAVVVRNARSGPARPAAAPVVRRDPARWPTPRTSDERAAVAADILDTADDHLGTRYLWGGSSPSTGFDCSGFLQHVFAAHGLHIPRVSQDQARAGQSIGSDPAGWVPGDLLFFASNGRTVDHAALYAGGGRIIHSSESGSGVRYDDLSTPRGEWYRRHLVGVRRVF